MILDTANNNEKINAADYELNKLKEAVPQCFNADGTFDMEKFQSLLKGKINIRSEGYELNFLGKSYARMLASLDTETVITPDDGHNAKDENKNSENIYITGDNLDALKHLLKSYERKIKCIYIDPPYNTGTDGFVYKDKFNFKTEELAERLSMSEDEAQRVLDLTKRKSASHSAWLTFMYPRLLLARDLLTDDGVIFISIDDNEQANLKLLCDDVFGEENFIAQIIIVSNSSKNNSRFISITHEYTLCYAKAKNNLCEIWSVTRNNLDEYKKRAMLLLNKNLSQEDIHKELLDLTKYPRFFEFDHYTYVDERGPFRASDLTAPESKNFYEIIHPVTGKVCKNGSRGWAYTKETLQQLLEQNQIYFGKDENIIPQLKNYLFENEKTLPKSIIFFDSQSSTKWMKANKFGFAYPKSVDFINYIISMCPLKNYTILDFFSGSATTAHAVMQLNAQDGG